MSSGPSEASVGELLKALTTETGTLVRQEVQLAGAEMRQKVARGAHDIGIIAAGGAVAHAGFVVLLAAAVVALSAWLSLWMAALVVGGLVVVVGAVLVRSGLSALKKIDVTPIQTVETLRQDKAWLKEQVR